MVLIIRAKLVKFCTKVEHENNQHVVYDFFSFCKSAVTNVATMRTLEVLPRQI